ncbi:MAG: GNAT family N-acetyltransferase [Oscillospiraceae bacterium]|jgi:ribosomal-protein-alanine N-acetyltransferase|nr:GNAT family N-acetyltransferase [Oscillospiraceae bacterium]
MNHKGTVMLETERLILRQFTPGDAEAMFRNWGGYARLEDAQEDMRGISKYENSTYRWAIVLKDGNLTIGSISAYKVDDLRNSLSVGYVIGEPWWHKKIMTEALCAVIKFFFEEVRVNRIAAQYNATNPRSGGVMLNSGMRYEGLLRQASRTGSDVFCYAILAEDYFTTALPQQPADTNHYPN